MILDESIELKNKEIKTINEMTDHKNMPIGDKRSKMQEMLATEGMTECVYEVMVKEGFLPENLNEGETYENRIATMMEDDDMMSEMYNAAMVNESDCAKTIHEWLNTSPATATPEGEPTVDEGDDDAKWVADRMNSLEAELAQIRSMLGTHQGTMAEDDDEDDDEEDGSPNPDYLVREKVKLDGAVNTFIKRINKMIPGLSKFNEAEYRAYFDLKPEWTIQGFVQFLSKIETETNRQYFERVTATGDFEYRKVFERLTNPAKRGFIYKYGTQVNPKFLDDFEEILSDIYADMQAITTYNAKIQKIEGGIENRGNRTRSTDNDDDVDVDDDELGRQAAASAVSAVTPDADLDLGDEEDDDMIGESKIPAFTPVKGKSVDSQNATNSKESADGMKDAEKSQETVEQKVDNLKNQKHELSPSEEKVTNLNNGMRNSLDLDYATELTAEEKTRIKDLAKNKVPADHANVDHDSTVNADLVKAAEDRDKEGITQDDYSSAHDVTAVEDNDTYEKTTAVNEELEKMKKMFNYSEEKNTIEKQNQKLNENEILLKSVSKKAFI